MKTSRILWGVGLITVAILLLLNAFGVTLGLPVGISPGRILLGVLCVVWLIDRLVRLRIPEIFFPLSFLVMLFERELARALSLPSENIASVPMLLFIALLLTIGSAALLPQRFRGKKPPHGHHGPMGNSVHYIDSNEEFEEFIKTDMGNCEVFFSNVEQYHGNGTIHVKANMGNIVLHIPESWYVISSVKNNMGSVHIPHSSESQGEKRLNLTGSVNMGNVIVKYVRNPSTETEENP